MIGTPAKTPLDAWSVVSHSPNYRKTRKTPRKNPDGELIKQFAKAADQEKGNLAAADSAYQKRFNDK
jgi:hypothetical protein